METLYTARLHGFPNLSRSSLEPALSEESILSLLIVLGSSVSLVGLVFAFITYSLFSDLRSLAGTTLMNLLAALFMTQLLYVIGVGGVPDPELCVALAFSLHYIRLCVFCWMLVMTHHMYSQFRTNLHLVPVTDNAIGKRFFRYSAFAWGIPAVFLTASIIIQYHDKAGKILDTASLREHNCWFLDKNSFIFGLLVPVVVMVVFIFSYIIRSAVVARYVISMQVDKRIRDKMRRKRTLQIVLFTKINILLLTVMVLGALTKLIKSDTLWIAYHVGQGLQGIFIAMLVTCNCQVLKLYSKTIKTKRSKYIPSYGNIAAEARNIINRGSSVTKSTSLQLLAWEPCPDPV
ncbi:PREDICTED: adhesion G protein-coupled receptor E2-like [Nicrophorus vespilloides]|uniref:Adhesion G protein-coupled receptor E2-like n=1 Tax=Nicrophorus vespilloides TaxID=110193 RepID=A0ABM1M4D9_NICVS|nr:PREDICTED: adhesion G protein-coupled receptor E2-like [Nicrophorus vespilloides]